MMATDAIMDDLCLLFDIFYNLNDTKIKPWKLSSERYEMPSRLSMTYIFNLQYLSID